MNETKSPVSEVNIYSLDYLREDKLAQENTDKGLRRGRVLHMAPSAKESSRSTNIRPVVFPKYQSVPILTGVRMHEKLDALIPGTKRKLFPNVGANFEETPCLNLLPDDSYCPVCERVKTYEDQATDARKLWNDDTATSKDKIYAEKFTLWHGSVNGKLVYVFCAIHNIGPVEDGKEWEKGKVPVGKDAEGKVIRVGKDQALKWVDPVMVIRWPKWKIEALYDLIYRKSITKERWEAKVGKKVSKDEWFRSAPDERPAGPFHPENGYSIGVVVEGKKLKAKWTCTWDVIEPISKDQKISMVVSYPEVEKEHRPMGFFEFPTQVDYLKDHPNVSVEEYRHKKMLFCRDKLIKKLGMDRPESREATTTEHKVSNESDDLGEAPETTEESAPVTKEVGDIFDISGDDVPF